MAQPSPKPAFSRRERDRAFEALARFSERAQFNASAKRAMGQFPLTATSPEGADQVEVDEQDFLFFLHWFLFDFTYRKRTVAEHFLTRPDRGAAR